MDERPTFGSLFAGIGGIDLGLERAGWRGRWQVEYEPFCQRVLAKHWPDVTRYGDIRDVDWESVEPVNLIAGGFPCQPFSTAGRRRGTSDARWLWPEFARAVRALRPRYVLVENVAGFLMAHGGAGDVLGDLAASGYDAEWDCLPAAAVGAPHRRDRLWLLAYAMRDGRDDGSDAGDGIRRPSGRGGAERGPQSRVEHGGVGVADAAIAERGAAQSQGVATASRTTAEPRERDRIGRPYGHRWPPEPDVGRVAHGVPARVDRLRSLGNAVVPQVVEFIGRRLLEAETLSMTPLPRQDPDNEVIR